MKALLFALNLFEEFVGTYAIPGIAGKAGNEDEQLAAAHPPRVPIRYISVVI